LPVGLMFGGQMLAVTNKNTTVIGPKLFSVTHMPYSVVTNNNTVQELIRR